MIYFVRGRAYSNKDQYIAELIRKSKNQVIYIVPEQWSLKSEQQMNSLGFSDEKVQVLSFKRLCNQVFVTLGGAAKKYISPAMRAALMSRAVQNVRDKLEYYNAAKCSAGFINRLIETLDEFKTNLVDIMQAYDMAKSASKYRSAKKFMDLWLIFSEYTKLLGNEYKDMSDDMVFAAKLLENSDMFSNATIVLDGFYGFTAQQKQILSLLMQKSIDCYYFFTASSNDPLFEPVNNEINKLRRLCSSLGLLSQVVRLENLTRDDDIGFLEKNFFTYQPSHFNNTPENINIYAALNLSDELAFIVGDIKRRVITEGRRYRDFAVLTNGISQSAFEAAFNRQNVPAFIDRKVSLLERPLTAFIRRAIDIVIYDFDYESVISFLKTGLTGIDFDDISLIENYTYIWNIHGARWYMDESFTQNPDGVGPLTEQGEQKLIRLNSLKERIVLPLISFKDDTKNATCRQLLSAVYKLMQDFSVKDSLQKTAQHFKESSNLRLYNEYLRIYDIFIDLLDDIFEVYADSPMTLGEFAEIMTAAARQTEVASIPSRVDEVLLADLDRTRLGGVKYLYIPAANEGSLPHSMPQDGLITEAERRLMQKAGMEISRTAEQFSKRERFLLYSALFSAQNALIFTYSRFTISGEQMLPSIYIQKLNDMFDIKELDTKSLDPHFYMSSPSLAASFIAHNDISDEKLNKLISEKSGFFFNTQPVNTDMDKLESAVIEGMYSRRLKLGYTGMTAFSECPFKYFVKYGLRANKRERVSFSYADIGSFMHYGLERLLRNYPDITQKDEQEILSIADSISEQYLNTVLFDYDKNKKRFLYLYNRMAKAFKQTAVNVVNELRVSDFKPQEFELKIENLIFDLTNGFSCQVNGVVDRVDAWQDYIKIVDYKTGGTDFDYNDIYNGLSLQLPLYALAVKSLEKYRDKHIAAMVYQRAGVPKVDFLKLKERSREEYTKAADKYYTRDGVFLLNQDVLESMENGGAGSYIPTNSKRFGERALNEKQLESLISFTKKQLVGIAEGIAFGEISPKPIKGVRDGCKYCDYQAICARTNDSENCRVYKKLKLENLFEILAKED